MSEPHHVRVERIGHWSKSGDEIEVAPTEAQASPTALRYLKGLKYSVAYMGFSMCRICGCKNGNREAHIYIGLIKYVIPSGYLHYLTEHGVAPDLRLLMPIASKAKEHTQESIQEFVARSLGQQMKHEHEAGYAFERGLKIDSDCPYPLENSRRSEWQEGWMLGRAAR